MAIEDGVALTGRRGRRKVGPSIGDVAKFAGVSAQTVSRVSTGADNVRPNTRQRVLDAMEQLGYVPNNAARALRNGSFGTLGVIAHRLARTGESRSVDAVVEAARAAGYTITLVDLEHPSSTDVTEAVQKLRHQSIDGLIIIRAEPASPNRLAIPRRLPVAVSDSRFAGHHPTVVADQFSGTKQAVEHLLSFGHGTVHHIAGPGSSIPAAMRVEAWQKTLGDLGRPVTEPLYGDWSAASGYEMGRRLAADPDVTAVFAANDEMAVGAMRAFHERGLSVPEDVSIVGFDDISVAEFLWPPLTTVRQDFRRIGHELVDIVMRQLGGEELIDHRVVVGVELITRGSVAAPPARR